MNIEINAVQKHEVETLRNLLEKYDYEFSQYDGRDINNAGLYEYDSLDSYWSEEKKHAYFIKVDNKLAGLVMVNDQRDIEIETDYSMAEFFVIYKYRKSGVGARAAAQIFNTHRGKWQINYHPKNIASKRFWNKVVKTQTKGRYKTIKNNPTAQYPDGTIGEVLVFST
jgi:predicted acetyltransferase